MRVSGIFAILLGGLIFGLLANSNVTYAQNNAPVASCDTFRIIVDYDDKNRPVIEEFKMGLKIFVDETQRYGYRAEYIGGEGKPVSTGDAVFVANVEIEEDIWDMKDFFFPELARDELVNMNTSVIYVKASQDNGGGMRLFSLKNKNGEVIAQLGTFGWTFFACK